MYLEEAPLRRQWVDEMMDMGTFLNVNIRTQRFRAMIFNAYAKYPVWHREITKLPPNEREETGSIVLYVYCSFRQARQSDFNSNSVQKIPSTDEMKSPLRRKFFLLPLKLSIVPIPIQETEILFMGRWAYGATKLAPNWAHRRYILLH